MILRYQQYLNQKCWSIVGQLVLLAFLVAVSVPLLADTAEMRVALDQIVIEGGERAPVQAVVKDGGVQLNLQHRPKAYNSVRFPVSVAATQFNTLQFKVRFNETVKPLIGFGVNLSDKGGAWNGTSFSKHAKVQEDGWYLFSWDIVNQPDIVKGLNLDSVGRIDFKFGFEQIPPGQTVTLTIADLKFVSGQSVRSGDPELYQQWQQYLSAYKPDYSDSSRYLQSPSTGRIATPIPLATAGRAQAEIVVPLNAAQPLKLAGTELSHWLSAISGTKIPVVASAGTSTQTRIYLGKQAAVGKFDDDLQWLGDTDGFAVRTQGQSIYLFGNTEKGTLNGVFAFLENNTDIIWPRPRRELGAVYGNNPDLKVVWADAREKPATRLRGWATNLGLRPEHEIWSVRSRGNYPKGGGGVKLDGERRTAHDDYVEFGGGHNISGFLGKENPERFYPTIEGQVPEKFNIWKHQPNFTAPGIEDVVAQNVLKFIAEKAPAHIDCININIEDNWGVSTDAKSLEPIKLPDGSLLPSTDPAFRSTQYFIFLNQVAKKIKAVHPQLMVGTYAYFFTAVPPKVPVEDNIRVYFCPYVRKDQRAPLSAPINDVWWRRLEGWAKATPNVVIREYYGIMNGFRPLAETVAFDVKSYVDRGVKEYTAELNPDETVIHSDGNIRGGGDEWDFMAMEFWVINRLYWNPNQDVEQLRKYYLRRTYREAAPAMEKFFGTIRAQWYEGTIPSDFEEAGNMMRGFVMAKGHEGTLLKNLEEASAAAKHPVSKKTVDVVANRFKHWLATAKKEPSKIVPDNALYYGWGPNNDWGTTLAWATSTVTEVAGKTVPAVRITLHGDRIAAAKPGQTVSVMNVFVKNVKSGDELTFVLRPAHPNQKPLQLTLTAEGASAKARLSAPPEAFQVQPDGSVLVRFKLAAVPGAATAFKGEELKRLTLAFSGDGLTAQPETLYYLTDLAMVAAAE